MFLFYLLHDLKVVAMVGFYEKNRLSGTKSPAWYPATRLRRKTERVDEFKK